MIVVEDRYNKIWRIFGLGYGKTSVLTFEENNGMLLTVLIANLILYTFAAFCFNVCKTVMIANECVEDEI